MFSYTINNGLYGRCHAVRFIDDHGCELASKHINAILYCPWRTVDHIPPHIASAGGCAEYSSSVASGLIFLVILFGQFQRRLQAQHLFSCVFVQPFCDVGYTYRLARSCRQLQNRRFNAAPHPADGGVHSILLIGAGLKHMPLSPAASTAPLPARTGPCRTSRCASCVVAAPSAATAICKRLSASLRGCAR